MAKRKMHTKYTAWRVGTLSAIGSVIFGLYSLPFLIPAVVVYDLYTLWFNPWYQLLRNDGFLCKSKIIFILIYGVAGFISGALNSKGEVGYASVFISIIFLIFIVEGYYHLNLLPKGRKK